eukprot:GILK01010466.1.p1 GENE.GILK01010466.1~~GILK01010466.1.p1  ORF type:complete len:547 (+),score=46.00 GILK01010466.1:76-1716(+)
MNIPFLLRCVVFLSICVAIKVLRNSVLLANLTNDYRSGEGAILLNAAVVNSRETLSSDTIFISPNLTRLPLPLPYDPAISVNESSIHNSSVSNSSASNSTSAPLIPPSPWSCDTISGRCFDLPFPVDVVYTWVNGSDPEHIKRRASTMALLGLSKNGADFVDDRFAQYRFIDNEELRFSIRSVEKYMPWARHIYIVTNGQVPSWLNLTNGRVTIATHDELFTDPSHLPSFSSVAIEIYLDRIPNLSETFIYLNDDYFFINPVAINDFWDPRMGIRVFTSWPVGRCDKTKLKSASTFGVSLCRSQALVHSRLPRHKVQASTIAHSPFVMSKSFMDHMRTFYKDELNLTSSQHFRSAVDQQYQYLYFQTYMAQGRPVQSTLELFKLLDKNRDGALDFHEVMDIVSRAPVHPVVERVEFNVGWLPFRLCLYNGTDPGFMARVHLNDLERCQNTTRHQAVNNALNKITITKNTYTVVDQALVGGFETLKPVPTAIKQIKDTLRSSRWKWACINDELADTVPLAQAHNHTLQFKQLLQDRYPIPSSFELFS